MVPKITEIYAFVDYKPDDPEDEGIMTFKSPLGVMPMICSGTQHIDRFKEIAEKLNLPYKILKFTLNGEFE